MSSLELLNAVIEEPSLFKYMFIAFISFNILIIIVGILSKNKNVSFLGSGLTIFFMVLFYLSQFSWNNLPL